MGHLNAPAGASVGLGSGLLAQGFLSQQSVDPETYGPGRPAPPPQLQRWLSQTQGPSILQIQRAAAGSAGASGGGGGGVLGEGVMRGYRRPNSGGYLYPTGAESSFNPADPPPHPHNHPQLRAQSRDRGGRRAESRERRGRRGSAVQRDAGGGGAALENGLPSDWVRGQPRDDAADFASQRAVRSRRSMEPYAPRGAEAPPPRADSAEQPPPPPPPPPQPPARFGTAESHSRSSRARTPDRRGPARVSEGDPQPSTSRFGTPPPQRSSGALGHRFGGAGSGGGAGAGAGPVTESFDPDVSPEITFASSPAGRGADGTASFSFGGSPAKRLNRGGGAVPLPGGLGTPPTPGLRGFAPRESSEQALRRWEPGSSDGAGSDSRERRLVPDLRESPVLPRSPGPVSEGTGRGGCGAEERRSADQGRRSSDGRPPPAPAAAAPSGGFTSCDDEQVEEVEEDEQAQQSLLSDAEPERDLLSAGGSLSGAEPPSQDLDVSQPSSLPPQSPPTPVPQQAQPYWGSYGTRFYPSNFFRNVGRSGDLAAAAAPVVTSSGAGVFASLAVPTGLANLMRRAPSTRPLSSERERPSRGDAASANGDGPLSADESDAGGPEGSHTQDDSAKNAESASRTRARGFSNVVLPWQSNNRIASLAAAMGLDHLPHGINTGHNHPGQDNSLDGGPGGPGTAGNGSHQPHLATVGPSGHFASFSGVLGAGANWIANRRSAMRMKSIIPNKEIDLSRPECITGTALAFAYLGSAKVVHYKEVRRSGLPSSAKSAVALFPLLRCCCVDSPAAYPRPCRSEAPAESAQAPLLFI